MPLQLAILSCLDRVHPLMAREEVLLIEINCLLPAPVTLTEMRQVLLELERRRWVISARARLDYVLWKVTAHGQAALAEISAGM